MKYLLILLIFCSGCVLSSQKALKVGDCVQGPIGRGTLKIVKEGLYGFSLVDTAGSQYTSSTKDLIPVDCFVNFGKETK